MNIIETMPNHLTGHFIISLTAIISVVSGCGVMPAGQVSTRIFTVTGFTLPVAMVYTGDAAIRAQLSNIASSRGAAQASVNRLVMQTVFNVLESQGRSALLPDAVIIAILGQLTINITYEPLECKMVALNPTADTRWYSILNIFINKAKDRCKEDNMDDKCIIVSNTVTGICTKMMAGGGGAMMCSMPVAIGAIPPQHLTIGGTISTTNIIMANWSRTIWQSVVNRAVRMLISGPFESNFFSASAVVSGN
ncbi:hypothetical protein KIN20_028750 [Parelaphostrongylus tenuis]|uniref:Uncharacterized protein n=1 Tax=Parelaphostrongylus tenuis TaxID=148309 RepID=A0AAD5R188_PARTN|nr:hypothetical protein KIN20_028750 [Parelaphostrongylus tenuis]